MTGGRAVADYREAFVGGSPNIIERDTKNASLAASAHHAAASTIGRPGSCEPSAKLDYSRA